MSETAELNRGKATTAAAGPALKVADRPEPKPPAISERDLLRLHQLWQTSLDPELLLTVFSSELKHFVPYDSLDYRCEEADLRRTAGNPRPHRCSYKLTLEQRSFGELELTRSSRFSEDELYTLERILGSLIHSLRNSINHRIAVQRAYTDCLTGMLNRNALENLFHKEVQRALRSNSHLSVLIIDIDHFKRINDSLGHQAGDQVLSQVAQVIESSIRGSDSAFRHGGEEFLVVLPGTDLKGARIAGDKIRDAIQQMGFAYSGRELPVTISVGATTLGSGDDMRSLIGKADSAMYRAKESGRNCLRTA